MQTPHKRRARSEAGRNGQALIETAVTVTLTALLFFGLVQMGLLFTAKEVVSYAANKGARAATVGLNNFMIYKVVRIGTIANAGRMVYPDPPGGPLAVNDLEMANIPWYLSAPAWNYLPAILDYEDWDTVSHSGPIAFGADGSIRVQVRQDFPLRMPLHRAFYAGDQVRLTGESRLDNHADLYIDDQGW